MGYDAQALSVLWGEAGERGELLNKRGALEGEQAGFPQTHSMEVSNVHLTSTEARPGMRGIPRSTGDWRSLTLEPTPLRVNTVATCVFWSRQSVGTILPVVTAWGLA